MIGLVETSRRSFWRAAAVGVQQADKLTKSSPQSHKEKPGTGKRTVKIINTAPSGGNADSFSSTYAYINEAIFGKHSATGGAEAGSTNTGGSGAAEDACHRGSRVSVPPPQPTSKPPAAAMSAAPALPRPCPVGDAVTANSSRQTGTVWSAAGQEQDSKARERNSSSHMTTGDAITLVAAPDLEQRAAAGATLATTHSPPLNSTDDLSSLLTYPLMPKLIYPVHKQLMRSLQLLADKVPSVSAVLEDTKSPEDKRKLEDWKAKMIRELGHEGFQRLQAETLRNGSTLHRCIEKQVDGGDLQKIEIVPAIAGYWSSLLSSGIMEELKDVQAVEHRMEHDQLRYKGVIDCVATYRGIPSVVEWKTSKKPKHSLSATYDHPLQVAAYMGIWNRCLQCQPYLVQAQRKSPVLQGMLVIAYENGDRADVLVMQDSRCQHYWQEWLWRLHVFWSHRQQPLAAADHSMAASSRSNG